MRLGELAGLRVLVTGSANGIGRATAAAFARGGAELLLADIDRVGLQRTAQLVEDRGGKTIFADAVDVANRQQMAAFAASALRVAGGVDILVNNAGIGAGGPFCATPLETWDRVLSVNLMGVVHGCHFFAPSMVERGRGHIVNVASILGLVGLPRVSAYAASKFAVVGLSRSLGAELRPSGVRVTAMCPGLIATDLVSGAHLSGAAADSRNQLHDAFRRGAPPERVARAIVRVVKQGRGSIVPVTGTAWVAHFLERLAPGLVALLAGVGGSVVSEPSVRESAARAS